jgi:hypothetical protein
MKITKTQLKQIIREELAEGKWLSDYGGEWEGGPPVEDDPYYGVEDDPNEREGRSNAYSAGYEEGYQGTELYWAPPERQKDLEYIEGWVEGKKQLDIETGAFKARTSTSVDLERDVE